LLVMTLIEIEAPACEPSASCAIGVVRHRPTLPPSPEPARRLRRELAARRCAGLPFDDAWGPSVRAAIASSGKVHRPGWSEAFASTRDVWRDAHYERSVSASAGWTLLDALAALDDESGSQVSGTDHRPVVLA
jgi:hypothetical protein